MSLSLTLCNTTALVPIATMSAAVWLIMLQSVRDPGVQHTHTHRLKHIQQTNLGAL